MLKLSDLAERRDFRAGDLDISPSRRRVCGPAGEIQLEPLIMQVFLLLLDAGGRVVTRNELFDDCWGGAMVGDDSLNRTIAGVRRIAAEVAPRHFEVETIPRTGYRLTGAIFDQPERQEGEQPPGQGAIALGMSRRRLIGATGAAALATAGGGLWWATSHRTNPEAAALIEQSERAIRTALPGSDEEAAGFLQQAVRLDADNAQAWGLLALVLRNQAEKADPADVSHAVVATEAAARRALKLDSREPNARTALATVRPEFGNWAATEDALQLILKDSPNNVPALKYLTMILQAVGRARESWELNERALALEPLSPVLLFRRGLKLWIFGRVPEADIAIDRALQLWPNHSAVWNARLNIFAFTGRAHAALAALEDEQTRPPTFRQASVDYWRSSLRALDTRARGDIEDAVRTNLQSAPASPYFATASMMVLSSLGQLDAAFAVAEGTLLRRGKLIGTIWAGKHQTAVHDQYWRRTMNLFTPATAAMRSDPRFRGLCEGMGMAAYWHRRGRGPDPMYGLNFV